MVVQLLKICHQMSKKVYSLSSRRTGLYDHDMGDTRGGTEKVFVLVFFYHENLAPKLGWAHWPVRHVMILDCPRPALAKGVEVDGVGDLS